MNEQTSMTTHWLDEEIKTLGSGSTGDRLPAMKFIEHQITEFDVDFSQPFQKYTDEKATKAIIPVIHESVKKNLWLNVRNPLYREIVHAGQKGVFHFKVLQTGTQANTKYVLVK